MYPGKTEPMTKNTTHSSIGCNGMANNDDYHGLEMYKNHAKDSTTEFRPSSPLRLPHLKFLFVCYMQPDPTTMECGRIKKVKLCVHFSRASILHHCICLDMHDHGVQLVDGVQFFPGSICVSGFATPVVNCGTARVPMGLPM